MVLVVILIVSQDSVTISDFRKCRIFNEQCDFTSLSASESLVTKLSGKTPCLLPISPLHQPGSPVSWRQKDKHFNYQFVMTKKWIKEFECTSQERPLDGGNNSDRNCHYKETILRIVKSAMKKVE